VLADPLGEAAGLGDVASVLAGGLAAVAQRTATQKGKTNASKE
jgi:hypothetical protein